MILHLVRHAEPLPGTSGVGPADRARGLTPRGEEQARRLAESLGPRLDRVVTSPYLRARSTARPLHEAASSPGRLEAREDLGEFVVAPDGEATDPDEVARRWAQVIAEPDRAPYPGGESVSGFQARVLAAVEALAPGGGRGEVAAVAHAGVVKVAFLGLCGVPLVAHRDLNLWIPPASVFTFQRRRRGWRLVQACGDGAQAAARAAQVAEG